PAHAALTWEWDDMHMPFALAPLAGDWVMVVASGFNGWKTELASFPSRTYGAIWNGYAYFGFDPGATGDERKRFQAEGLALFRARAEITEPYWYDEVVPELKAMFAEMRAAPVETGSGDEVATAWERAWTAMERAWNLHFTSILGPYQILEDLADLYESVTPNASPGEALRLMQGTRHELYETELGVERLAAAAAAAPDVAAGLRSGVRSPEALADLAGGSDFVAALRAFLGEHGHMGQSVDDLALASWGEDPGLLLAEVAKRLEHPTEGAEARRARLAHEADELAAAARERFAGKPEELARFEHVLDLSRRIGPLTEVHNYWIDRGSQAATRAFSMRVGARLVRDGVLERPDDILYLRRSEVPDLLRHPEDRRALVAERRARHAEQAKRQPPRFVGKAPESTGPVDRFDTARVESTEADVLRGTGASAGVVRGPARVVLTSNEFDRIKPGDVIICPSSNPSWVPVFTIAGGLVTNTGGVLSHAAVVAREFGLPAVVGVAGATTTVRDGQLVEIDGTAGTVRLL
ncbi:MAG TPA: PEP-utilizing enzyme, partial [Candidatus Acidoferrales bacterium]|nr:PEP-utilizing enzyme [Candidatus Acidoferrales bacterium]